MHPSGEMYLRWYAVSKQAQKDKGLSFCAGFRPVVVSCYQDEGMTRRCPTQI